MRLNKKENSNTKQISKNDLINFFEKYPGRIELLGNKQKAFIRLFLSCQNYRTMAIMAKVNEATIARRLIKIAKHILSNDFINALIASENMDTKKMEIIKDHYAKQIAISRIAKQRNIPVCRVRKIIAELK